MAVYDNLCIRFCANNTREEEKEEALKFTMSTQQEPFILKSIDNGIQKVIFNRPNKKNAITSEMYDDIINTLAESAKNDAVIALVLTGNGDFYSSGNDFISHLNKGLGNVDEEVGRVQKFVDMLITYPKLLIAVVNGPAIGIAATTLALFDMIFASETAYFLTPFCKLGLVAEGCSSYTFPRIMGPSKASEMLFFGEKLSAAEATKVGFISKVYKADSVHEVWDYLKNISLLSAQSIAATKRLLNRWNRQILLEVNKEEMKELSKVYSSDDCLNRMMEMMTKKSKL